MGDRELCNGLCVSGADARDVCDEHPGSRRRGNIDSIQADTELLNEFDPVVCKGGGRDRRDRWNEDIYRRREPNDFRPIAVKNFVVGKRLPEDLEDAVPADADGDTHMRDSTRREV